MYSLEVLETKVPRDEAENFSFQTHQINVVLVRGGRSIHHSTPRTNVENN